MGINFVAASPTDILNPDSVEPIVRELRAKVSASVPLGEGAPAFMVPADMGWNWWSELQAFATRRLGEEGSVQIRAVDAYSAVYVDADIERVLIWPDGKPEYPEQARPSLSVRPKPWYLRPLAWLGLASNQCVPPEVAQQMEQMITDYGTRPGEWGSIQVGNLRKLHEELSNLASQLGHETTPKAMKNLLESYFTDERCEEDFEVQCLCHAWLTSKHAIDHGVPMWLLK